LKSHSDCSQERISLVFAKRTRRTSLGLYDLFYLYGNALVNFDTPNNMETKACKASQSRVVLLTRSKGNSVGNPLSSLAIRHFCRILKSCEKSDETRFATNIRVRRSIRCCKDEGEIDNPRFFRISLCARKFFSIFRIAVNLLRGRNVPFLPLSSMGRAKPLRFFRDRSRSTRKSYR